MLWCRVIRYSFSRKCDYDISLARLHAVLNIECIVVYLKIHSVFGDRTNEFYFTSSIYFIISVTSYFGLSLVLIWFRRTNMSTIGDWRD